MEVTYTLSCQNNSALPGTFCIYHVLKNNDPSLALQPKSLVWMAKKVHPKTKAVFTWSENLFFVWGEYLSENRVYTCAKIKADMELPGKRAALFGCKDGAYLLQSEKRQVPQGKFLIIADETVSSEEAVAGLGCFAEKSGIGTIVYDMQPNLTYLIRPEFDYYVTFGNYCEGQIISPDNIMAPYAKIPFSSEKTDFIAVMRSNNQLIVRQNKN